LFWALASKEVHEIALMANFYSKQNMIPNDGYEGAYKEEKKGFRSSNGYVVKIHLGEFCP
jgi:hypothetical protein